MPNTEADIRARIRRLYETAPQIRMDVSLQRPKLSLVGAEATITGVYPHIFQIEETSTGVVRRHTLQYADVLIRRIVIYESEPGKE